MKISELLQKDYWYRRVNQDVIEIPFPTNAQRYREVQFSDGIQRRRLTNDDFLNELSPSAHSINSKYWSTRPIRELVARDVEEHNADGSVSIKKVREWVVTGYDSVETVRLGLQMRFANAKASFFAAKGFNISNETRDSVSYDTLMSWKDVAGLDVGYLEVVQSCFKSGDAAIYLFKEGNIINFKVFSSLYGDTLYPSYDDKRNPVVAREYNLNGKHAVDIFTVDSVETWVQGIDNKLESSNTAIATWWSKVKGWFKNTDFAASDDGWVRIAKRENQICNFLNPCVYFRIDDVVWGVAQDDIEGLERSMSYLSEEVKNMAYPELFVKATKIESMPPIGAHGRTWAVKGSAEDIKAADIKSVDKPDMSNMATVDFKHRHDSIVRSTMSVFVDPELVKSSDISGVGIKVLYGPEIQFAQTMWPQFYHQIKYMVEVFKSLVAKIENNDKIATLRTSIWQEIYLPEDEAARIKNELDQLYAKAKSRKAVMADLNNQHLGDYEQIMREWEEELEMKARIPAEEKAKVDAKYKDVSDIQEPHPLSVHNNDNEDDGNNKTNPNLPKINNQSPGKTLLS